MSQRLVRAIRAHAARQAAEAAAGTQLGEVTSVNGGLTIDLLESSITLTPDEITLSQAMQGYHSTDGIDSGDTVVLHRKRSGGEIHWLVVDVLSDKAPSIASVSGRLAALESGVRPVVAALPGTPFDGQEVYFQTAAMAVDGVMWRLRYRDGSASVYKWEFVGGARLYSLNTVSDTPTTASAFTFVDLANSPTVTLPLAGEYDVAFGALLTLTAAALRQGDLGAFTAANAGIGLPVATHIGTQNFEADSVSIQGKSTALAANTQLKLRLATNPAGAVMSVGSKYILAQPVRVG